MKLSTTDVSGVGWGRPTPPPSIEAAKKLKFFDLRPYAAASPTPHGRAPPHGLAFVGVTERTNQLE